MADLTVLQSNGSSSNRIDLIFVAEGYTQAERSKFLTDAQNFNNYVFSASNKALSDPFFTYSAFFNSTALFVPSLQSGYTTSTTTVNTAFGASAHLADGRLVYGDSNAVLNAVNAALPADAHEIVITLVNSANYGGAGGSVAWATAGNRSSYEIALHEIGHSFAKLQDEYADASLVSTHPLSALSSSVHVSASSDPNKVAWKDWIGFQDGLGTVGVYQGGYYRASGVWRATEDSKMLHLGVAFSAPEKEAFINQFYKSIGQYATVVPDGPFAFHVTTPDRSLFSFQWKFDERIAGGNTDKFDLLTFLRQEQDGFVNSSVTLDIADATGLIRNAAVVAQSTQHFSFWVYGEKVTLSEAVADYTSPTANNCFVFANDKANIFHVDGNQVRKSYIDAGSGNDFAFASTGSIYFDGGAGVDTVVFSASFADSKITKNADGSYKISSSDDGVDDLVNVEYAQFADQTVALVTVTAPIKSNFNGDGTSDILLQNVVDGSCYAWNMRSKALVDHGFVGWATGPDWQVKGAGDFNTDGKSDILLQNRTDGACFIWEMNGKTLLDSGFVGWSAGADWRVKATGDFNGDGKSDILLQNRTDGACFIWEMNGKTLLDSGFVGWAAGADWQVKGAGDFNGDGKSDILLQNSTDGACFVWEMNGTALVGSGFVGWAPGPDWQVKGTGDFNGDEKSDILLQNANDGSCYIWEMNGKTLVDSGFVGWAPGADWQATGTGDFNGDGKSDILLQNNKDGSCYMWELNGTGLVDHGFVGWAAGPDWHVVA